MRIKLPALLVVMAFGSACQSGEEIKISRDRQDELFRAVMGNHVEDARHALASGTPVDVVNWSGNQPIHYAVKNGNVEMVKLLLASGAKADAENTKCTLMWGETELNQRKDKWELVIVAKPVRKGIQPIHYAVLYNEVEIAKLLISAGAKVDAVTGDKEGLQPYNIALACGNAEIKKFLFEQTAKTVVDPIDQFVARYWYYDWLLQSQNPFQITLASMPSTASMEQVVSEMLRKGHPNWHGWPTVPQAFRIVASKKARVGQEPWGREYTAALVSTQQGRKMVLFRHEDADTLNAVGREMLGVKLEGCWDGNVYDMLESQDASDSK